MSFEATLLWKGRYGRAQVQDEAEAAAVCQRISVLLRALHRLPEGALVLFAAEGPLREAGEREAQLATTLLGHVQVYLSGAAPPVTWGLYHIDGDMVLIHLEEEER